MKVVSKPMITIEGDHIGPLRNKLVKIQMDHGSECNIISQRFALEEHLEPILNAQLPLPKFMDGNKVYCYGAYWVSLRMRDDWNQQRTVKHVFYAIDKEGPPLTLGMPAQSAERTIIHPHTRKWRFGVDMNAISIDTAESFAKAVKNQPCLFSILITPVSHENSSSQAINQARDVAMTQTGAQVGNQAVTLGATSCEYTSALPQGLHEYEDVFDTSQAGMLPQHSSTSHAIETTGDPPYGPLYNLSNNELEVLRTYLDDALGKGWIRHSVSPAGAPILFVPKKDGGLRLCVDYRALNKVTVKNRHPLPLISETLDRLYGAKVFSKLDLKDAYHRIRICEGDEWKTAFRTRYGHFEYLVMPFGLTNAPATFQAYINKALSGLLDEFCVVYLDDILIFSESEEQHMRHLRAVLERLRRFALYANPKKCQFFTEQVEFLGFIVSTTGVSMDRSRINTIQEWPRPKTYNEVQQFLGFCNFFRRFIYRYSQVSSPMTGLLKGSQAGVKTGPFKWPDDAEASFQELKKVFESAAVLHHFNPARRTRIETDASDFGVAGILSQQDSGGQWHPIAFWSRKMIDAERNYEVHDQELLAIVEAFKQWRHYCEGNAFPIEVITDHDNLRAFMKVKQLNKRQARWAMKLSMYDFSITHRAGRLNAADAPSRRPDYQGENESLSRLLPTLQHKFAKVTELRNLLLGAIATHISRKGGEIPTLTDVTRMVIDTSSVHIERLREPQAARAVEACETQSSHSCDEAMELDPVAGTVGCKQLVPRFVACLLAANETAYSEGSLSMLELIKSVQLDDPFCQKLRASDAQGTRTQDAGWTLDSEGIASFQSKVYVPNDAAVRDELLKKHHDDPLAGHFGVTKTLELLQRKYYWNSMRNDVKTHIKTCDICQRLKSKRHRPYGDLNALPIPEGPWQEISMDFITDLPPSAKNECVYDAILVVVDRYTKMVRYLPTNKTTAAVDLADIFFDEVVLKFGCPKGIVTDRGSVFTSNFWSQVCYHTYVKRRLSTAFHPQTDGQTERQNQTLEQYLRIYCDEQQGNWALLLPMAEFAYHQVKHELTGMSPFEAMYGYNPEFELRAEGDTSKREVPAATQRVEKLISLRESLRQRWKDAQESRAKYYNKHYKPIVFKKNELVLLLTKNLKLKALSKKFAPKFAGPFRVEQAIGNQAYRLYLPQGYKIHNVFHVSLLEPYHRRQGAVDSPDLSLPELLDDEEEWEIENIVDDKVVGKVKYYQVKWKGWPSEYNEYIPEQELQHAKSLRQEYDRKAKKKRKA